jgi:hypothetical protein
MADEWIAFGRAAVMLDGNIPVQRALILSKIKSRGVPALDGVEPVDIAPDYWAIWTFNLKRQSLDPPGYRGIPTGFAHVELLLADVERLAATVKPAPERPPRARAALPAKESIPEAAGAVLRRLYPVRPPGRVKGLRARVQQELGIESISETTFKRVMARAWGKPGPK